MFLIRLLWLLAAVLWLSAGLIFLQEDLPTVFKEVPADSGRRLLQSLTSRDTAVQATYTRFVEQILGRLSRNYCSGISDS